MNIHFIQNSIFPIGWGTTSEEKTQLKRCGFIKSFENRIMDLLWSSHIFICPAYVGLPPR